MLPTRASTSRSCTSSPKRARTSRADRVAGVGGPGEQRLDGRPQLAPHAQQAARGQPDDAGRARRASARRGSGAVRCARPRRSAPSATSTTSPSPTRRASAGAVGDPGQKRVGPLVDRRSTGERRRPQLAPDPVGRLADLDVARRRERQRRQCFCDRQPGDAAADDRRPDAVMRRRRVGRARPSRRDRR